VIGGKPIAVFLQFISDVSAIKPLIAFYDIHGKKREVLFFYFVSDATRDDHDENDEESFLRQPWTKEKCYSFVFPWHHSELNT
jgi:hypothetical protein